MGPRFTSALQILESIIEDITLTEFSPMTPRFSSGIMRLIDWDSMESKYGRERIRKLLESIRERGYEDPASINAILELDRIDIH